jgi:hypothetical protein
VEVAVAEVVADAEEDVAVKKSEAMKKILLYLVPLMISMIWLIITHHIYNPISMRGPEFLKFYLILLLGSYAFIMILKFFKEGNSKITSYFMIFILMIGIVKLIKGLMLEKPVGYLIMLLVIQGIVILCQPGSKADNKHKQI